MSKKLGDSAQHLVGDPDTNLCEQNCQPELLQHLLGHKQYHCFCRKYFVVVLVEHLNQSIQHQTVSSKVVGRVSKLPTCRFSSQVVV